MITLFRTSPLKDFEVKWVRSTLNQMGLSFEVDVRFTTDVIDAVSQIRCCVVLGGVSRAQLLNTPIEHETYTRGTVVEWSNTIVVSTWDIPTAVKDSICFREFRMDMLKAKCYAYGFGNRQVGFVEEVVVSDGQTEEVFNLENIDLFYSQYEKVLQ